jgi:WXG100 family type VII secretion target
MPSRQAGNQQVLGKGDVVAEPINVDVQAMVSAASEMEDKHGSIRSQVTGLQSEIDGLMASWTGQAAGQFNNAMQNFYEDCNTVLTSLQHLAQAVDSSAQNYERAHQMTTDDAQSLASRISATPAGLPGF